LRYDLYGRGYSGRPEVEYTHELFSRQLSELISDLDLSGPKVLVGLSMGGPIAASYHAAHSGESIGLVLIAPEIVQSTNQDIFPLNLPLVGEYMMAAIMEPYLLPLLQAGDFYHPESFPEWEDLYRPQFQFKGTGHALLSTIRGLTAFNPEEVYHEVQSTGKPVLLIWGREDQTIGWDQIIILQEILPDMETIIVEDAGHLVHFEKAAEVETRLVGYLNSLDW
jgi:pimeloyl-ACP methyl ester carboxylesterase